MRRSAPARSGRPCRIHAAAALALAALIAPLTGADAATTTTTTATTRTVVATDFPEIEDVAAIYPFYEGGWRQFVSDPELILITRDCLYSRVGPTAPTGGYALYAGADPNPTPFDDGEPEAQVELYRFNSRARAHDVLEQVRRTVTRCYGRSADGPRVRVRRAVTVPALGSEAPLAWRTHLRNNPDRDEFPEYDGIDIWMRRGRFLVLADVHQLTPPSMADAVALARAALESIG